MPGLNRKSIQGGLILLAGLLLAALPALATAEGPPTPALTDFSGEGLFLAIAGLVLMICEAFVAFFGLLGALGFILFLSGIILLFDDPALEGINIHWPALIIAALFGLAMLAVAVRLTIRAIFSQVSTGPESMIGKTARVVEWHGDYGSVQIYGELWQAFSDGALNLAQDEAVLISQVEGLKLKIRSTKP